MAVSDEGLPQGEEKARRVRDMFDAIAGRYDLVNRVMTFGMDVGWRRRSVRELRLPGGALVADLACGTGDLCRELSRNGYRAAGFDFSFGMLAQATTEAPLVQADVLRLPLADRSTVPPVGSPCETWWTWGRSSRRWHGWSGSAGGSRSSRRPSRMAP